MFCKGSTTAKKRYQRAVFQFMAAYVVVLLCSSWFVKHDGGEHFFLYFWSVIPAIPVVGVIVRMGQYLREETDEYQRWLAMQGILAGAGALLAVTIVTDFLRAFAKVGGLPPFWEFLIFCVVMAGTQAWNKLRNRGLADE